MSTLDQVYSEQTTYRFIAVVCAITTLGLTLLGMRCEMNIATVYADTMAKCLEAGVEPMLCRAGIKGIR